MEESILISQHRREKEQSTQFKDRRTIQWNENYALYRDKVSTNRLTQRQAVNIPIIRDSLQSWISKIDEDPTLTFETRGNSNRDRDGEIKLNELWGHTKEVQKLDLLDNLDKKIVGLQGRSFKYWYFKDNQIKCAVVDPYDIDIDPKVNPFDLNTAFYFTHKHIFVPLRTILANPTYTAEGKNQLKTYLDSKQGLLEADRTSQEAQMRRERLENLGAHNFDDYHASDVTVELNRSHKLVWNESEQRFVRNLIVIAMDSVVLYNKPLKEAVGIDYLPYTSWASDPDLNDLWSDGIADNVRTMNKVINMYFSQDLENRSYRNFGMYFYNTMNGTFTPRGFDAKPFGMYGVPGNPDEVMKQMEIQPLGDTATAIEYFKTLIQSSVAQTPTERGVAEKTGTTLGEVQLSLQQSQTRQQVVAKQYRTSWEESGRIFYDLMNSNSRGRTKLYKKASDGSMRSEEISRDDWYHPEGYEVKVVLKSEREANDDMDFKKTSYIKNSFQDNPVAQKIAKKKELELLGWNQDEINEVLQFEDQKMQGPSAQVMQQQQMAQAQVPVTQPA
jgi:hypothetical protein